MATLIASYAATQYYAPAARTSAEYYSAAAPTAWPSTSTSRAHFWSPPAPAISSAALTPAHISAPAPPQHAMLGLDTYAYRPSKRVRLTPSTPSPEPPPPIKTEPDPEQGFIFEFNAHVPDTPAPAASVAVPSEVPLRATQATPAMRRMMGVFRLNPFAMHDGVSSAKQLAAASSAAAESDDMTFWGAARPLEHPPVELEWQAALSHPYVLVPACDLDAYQGSLLRMPDVESEDEDFSAHRRYGYRPANAGRPRTIATPHYTLPMPTREPADAPFAYASPTPPGSAHGRHPYRPPANAYRPTSGHGAYRQTPPRSGGGGSSYAHTQVHAHAHTSSARMTYGAYSVSPAPYTSAYASNSAADSVWSDGSQSQGGSPWGYAGSN